jgi:alkanesulfonate monooxygenase SsuD/methylene tetrahydromethanopterin reductase-like flavin-dependent oxidoreductase (luciferase family)
MGLGRFIVVADSDEAALALARRAYPKWHDSFTFLPRLRGIAQQHPRPADFDTLVARGQGFAGAPASVTTWLRAQLDETGTNYVVGQFAFGDLTLDECRKSIGLFVKEVMPALRG